jgi:hypothetical protein
VKSNLLAISMLVPVIVAAQASNWSFGAGASGWQARATSITLTRVSGLRDGSRSGLPLQGRVDDALGKYGLNPLPPSLEEMRGTHPRLYLDAARITQLRQAIHTTHAPMWKELRQWADRAVERGAPAYRERDNSSGDEQLWQRDVGNAMPVLALAWVLSGERQYLDATALFGKTNFNTCSDLDLWERNGAAGRLGRRRRPLHGGVGSPTTRRRLVPLARLSLREANRLVSYKVQALPASN